MPLAPGTRLGPYEVIAALGAGGMGEVYRARDTKLNRDVALKVLPEAFTSDADRLARFRREAQVLASLNHPNIAAIYGFEDSDATHALVMELVEGDDLSVLIDRGLPEVESGSSRLRDSNARQARGGGAPRGLSIDDALSIARQIADALEGAHEQGIIHRDLKPANIKVRDDGMVKVLDFGLAKAMDPAGASSTTAMNSPTLTNRATQLGIILGTAAYMAPEQARGRAVDRRADIWAFGIVLYEMLSGRRAFDGDDVSITLANVLKEDVKWDALPAGVSTALCTLIRRCLEKDPKRRLGWIGEARYALDDPAAVVGGNQTAGTSRGPKIRGSYWPWLLGGIAGAALATLGAWMYLRPPTPAPARPMRFAFAPSAKLSLNYFSTPDRIVTISPNGRHIAYVTGDGSLVVRALEPSPGSSDGLTGEPIRGIGNARSPFFSPDGEWVAYFVGGGELRKVPVNGGSSLLVCPVASPPRGGSWGIDDTIVFATADVTTGLWTVPAAGGQPMMISKPDPAKGEGDHQHPAVLPGGAIAFTITSSSTQVEHAQIAVLDRKTGATTVLVRSGSQPEYLTDGSGGGYLVYGSSGSLRAVRFDLANLKVESDPVTVAEQVGMASTGASEFGLARDGTLVYLPGGVDTAGALRTLAWIDRKGQEEPIKAEPRPYFALRLAPDQTRLAVDIRDGVRTDVWIYNFANSTLMPLTFDPGQDLFPVWSVDSRRIVFSSQRGEQALNLYWQSADGAGAPERLSTSQFSQVASSFSPDGSALLLAQRTANDDIGILDMKSRAMKLAIQTPTSERNAEVSPDGRWLAYESFETTPPQIYVRPFPDLNAGRWQISKDGGIRPTWSKTGDELFYIGAGATGVPTNVLYAVTIPGTPASAGNPEKLFNLTAMPGIVNGRSYDVSRDGKRFVIIKEPATDASALAASQQFVVVVNWIEVLKSRMKR